MSNVPRQVLAVVLCGAFLLFASGCASSLAVRGDAPSDEPAQTKERVPLIPEAYHYFTTGNYLASTGDDSGAVIQYRRALTYDPASRAIRLALAQAYAREGRYDEAAITAESIRPRDSEVLSFLAQVYARMRSQARRQAVYEEWATVEPDNVQVWQFLANVYRIAGDTVQQMAALERVAELRPDPAVYETLGFLKLQTGQTEEAESWFRRAVVSDSSQKATRVMLGLAQIWSERDEPDSALVYYRHAVELNYYNTELRRRFFYYLLQQELAEEALAEARQILKLSPDEPDVLYRIAILEYDAEQLDSAEVHLTDWITRYGDDALGRFLLGRIAQERGDTATAEAQYLQSIHLADSLVEGYLALGFLYNQQGMHDSAVSLYGTALNHRPDHAGLLFGLGAALEQGDRFDEAVTTFERLIALEPEHAPALNYLGYMWADRGLRLAEALDLIKRAVDIQPDNGAYLDSYAWVLYRLGRARDAERQIREALNYIDEDAVVFEHYGDILADLGRRDEAQENWQRALDLDPDNETLKEKLKR